MLLCFWNAYEIIIIASIKQASRHRNEPIDTLEQWWMKQIFPRIDQLSMINCLQLKNFYNNFWSRQQFQNYFQNWDGWGFEYFDLFLFHWRAPKFQIQKGKKLYPKASVPKNIGNLIFSNFSFSFSQAFFAIWIPLSLLTGCNYLH